MHYADVARRTARDAALRVFDKQSCDGSDRAEARSALEAQLAKLCDTARRDLEARSDACCDAALRNLAERDAFADLPAAEEDESHGGLVIERARTGLWEPLCDDISSKFRGPRREARLVDALSTTAVPRVVEPAVAEALRRGAASRLLLQKRLEKEQSDERAEAKKRFDEAEARASAERSRLTTEIESISTKLAATERDVDELRSSKRIVDDDLAACRRTAKDLEADVARTQSSLEDAEEARVDDRRPRERRESAGDAGLLEATRRELRSEREMSATLTQSLEQLQNRVADLDGRLKRSEDDSVSATAGDAIEQRKELAELKGLKKRGRRREASDDPTN